MVGEKFATLGSEGARSRKIEENIECFSLNVVKDYMMPEGQNKVLETKNPLLIHIHPKSE